MNNAPTTCGSRGAREGAFHAPKRRPGPQRDESQRPRRTVSDPGTTAALLAALGCGDTAAFDGSAEAARCLLLLVRVAHTITRELSLDHQLPQLIELIVAGLDAERATLFLYDSETGELFSRVARGEGVGEIRIRSTRGIAGVVFGSGLAEIVSDAYQDSRFNPELDRRTGFALCQNAPLCRLPQSASRTDDRRYPGIEQAFGVLHQA